MFLHISSSYAKILGETNFHAREIPRSGWKVEGGEEEEKKRKKEKSRWKQWPASLRPSPRVAHASTPGPKRSQWTQWPASHPQNPPGPKLNFHQPQQNNVTAGYIGLYLCYRCSFWHQRIVCMHFIWVVIYHLQGVSIKRVHFKSIFLMVSFLLDKVRENGLPLFFHFIGSFSQQS